MGPLQNKVGPLSFKAGPFSNKVTPRKSISVPHSDRSAPYDDDSSPHSDHSVAHRNDGGWPDSVLSAGACEGVVRTKGMRRLVASARGGSRRPTSGTQRRLDPRNPPTVQRRYAPFMVNPPPPTPLIEMSTVLVLGAGASKGFGLPLGSTLREMMIRNMMPEYTASIEDLSRNLHQHFNQSASLAESLRHSPVESIDEFLSYHPNLRDLGKKSIAVFIEQAEAMALRNGLAIDWHRWFFRQLRVVKKNGSLDFGNLSIVTFNYDRTLEAGLAGMLASVTGRPVGQCWEERASWPIYHVYGELASEVFQYSPTRLHVQRQYQGILRSCDSIFVMGDERKSPERAASLQRIHTLVNAAERIVFCGFGYDPKNLEVIGVPVGGLWSKSSFHWVGGTGLGLKGQPLRDAEARIGFRDTISDMNCGDYLYHHFSSPKHEW